VIWSISSLVPLRQFGQGRLPVVFNEELLGRPATELPRVFHLCRLDYDEAMLERTTRPSATTVNFREVAAGGRDLAREPGAAYVKSINDPGRQNRTLHQTEVTESAMPQSNKHGAPSVAAGDREPVLDGIRGLAILLVLAHHLVYSSGIDRHNSLDLEVFRFAHSLWLGVDLFFVLSGFLITGILYEAKGAARYFRSFYGRRVLRIFPLYYGFLAFALLFFPLWLPTESAKAMVDNQGWYWLYLSNFYVALQGWQEPSHLGHFWSLAIEEQFYLLWPMAVWALDRRQLLRLAAACFVVALALRILQPFGMSTLAAYVLLPTRMDTLAAGAFLALLIRGEGGMRVLGRWPAWIMAVSVVALGVLYHRFGRLIYNDPIVSTIGYSFIAAMFAALIGIVITAPPGNWLRRVMSSFPPVFLGKYSYGLYVVHVPIIMFLSEAGFSARMFPRLLGSSLPGVMVFCAVGGMLSLGCAVAIYHLWEAPFLRLKRYFPYAKAMEGVPAPSGPRVAPGKA
jgi:peptidoglycan/LPS O-acetylase OafA/YrhL